MNIQVFDGSKVTQFHIEELNATVEPRGDLIAIVPPGTIALVPCLDFSKAAIATDAEGRLISSRIIALGDCQSFLPWYSAEALTVQKQTPRDLAWKSLVERYPNLAHTVGRDNADLLWDALTAIKPGEWPC